ncbi:Ribonucleases P/MRP protein subunit pop1 [Coemansia sp. RSA 1250]|nr:Ribonucleases P/MRP protein subunit pop1 [Coemansia sp. RSA 1250]
MDAGSNSNSDKKRKAPPQPERGQAKRYTLGKARSVDVVSFVEARAFEINALQKSLQNARASGNTRAFQTLPRHLRRRAASHNVKRIPARLRERAISEMKKSAQSSKTLGETGRLTNAKKSRRYKRRNASGRAEFERRQHGKRWLETHVWHAKRMRMRELWNTMIAETPNERSHRAAYRAAKENTHIQDISYYATLELTGPEAAIVALLRPLVPPTELTVAMRPYASGARMAPLTLYRKDMYPRGLLGPATALWQPGSSGSCRTLWLRVHPASSGAVAAELNRSVEAQPDFQVEITDVSQELVSFELLGAQSTPLLATVLSQATDPASRGASVLQLARALPSPAVLPESVVIGLRIHDPRLEFPFKRALGPLSPEEQLQLQQVLLQWPEDAAQPDPKAGADGGIWDRAECAKVLAKRPSEKALNERRQKHLVPGTRLQPDPAVDVTVPILLIRTGPETMQGARMGQAEQHLVDELTHGWTLLAPRGWGMALWMALVFAGARAQGLNERHHVAFEAGLPSFPANWPGTSAYDQWAGAAASAAFQKWLRRPPGKRANYLKFGIESPFFAPFHSLLKLPHIPAAYPQVQSDDLECRMKRLRKISSKKRASKADSAAEPNAESAIPDSDSTAEMWLVNGERLTLAVTAMLAGTCSSETCDSESFLAWARPLLEAVCGSSHDIGASDLQLLDCCLVRVRLTCSKRGVPAANAPICIDPAQPFTGANIIGYVMTGSFSLARGCGMAVGACSLRGLFRFWTLRAQHARPSVCSMDDGPSVQATLSVI